MRQVVLYIAMSLDGYIADTEGGVGWLDRLEGLVLYRWNRRYPADAWLDVRPGPPGWTLARREEFSGHSHERIAKEVYTR